MATPVKRGREQEGTPGKRGRVDHIARLCDVRAGAELFTNEYNATRAKEKGWLRSRDGTGTYEEV